MEMGLLSLIRSCPQMKMRQPIYRKTHLNKTNQPNNYNSLSLKLLQMRKIFLTTLLGILTMSLFAQELEDVKDRIQKGKWKEAQEKVDKYLANEKNAKKPEGWYYKAVVYDN